MKTLSAKASSAVFRSANEPMFLSSVELSLPGEGETIVKVTCYTICGSDLQTIQGARVAPMPTTLGHEILGAVSYLPPRPPLDVLGNPIPIGAHITWSVGASCGTCLRCQQGIPQKYDKLFEYDHELLADGGELSGGFAEYCLVRSGTAIVQVPETLPDEVATPKNCATATVMAAMRTAGPLQEKKMLVLGKGMLGLACCAEVSAQHAAHVHACDQNPMRLAKASALGTSKIIPSVSDDDYPFASVVEKSFSLTEINDATSFAFTNQTIRVSIVPQNSIGSLP